MKRINLVRYWLWNRLWLQSALLGTGALFATGALSSCSDVPMDCTTGRGVFAVRYIGTEACGLGNGELIGAQTYQGQGSSQVDGVPLPDLTQASAAIQPQRLGQARDTALTRKSQALLEGTPYAFGRWDQPRPDANNICSVASMQASIKNQEVLAEAMDNPATDEDETVAVSATDRTYAWNNVRFYNTPGIQGLQFDANLTYTNALFPGGSCTTTVKAVGVFFPTEPHNCMTLTNVETLDPADPAMKAKKQFLTAATPDNSYCADITRSGVSTDFPTTCVPATALEYQATVYSCTTATPPVCTAVVPETKVSTLGLCLLTSDQIPVLK